MNQPHPEGLQKTQQRAKLCPSLDRGRTRKQKQAHKKLRTHSNRPPKQLRQLQHNCPPQDGMNWQHARRSSATQQASTWQSTWRSKSRPESATHKPSARKQADPAGLEDEQASRRQPRGTIMALSITLQHATGACLQRNDLFAASNAWMTHASPEEPQKCFRADAALRILACSFSCILKRLYPVLCVKVKAASSQAQSSSARTPCMAQEEGLVQPSSYSDLVTSQ